MATFGEFFRQLRQRIEKTGRTDSACGDMDRYKYERRSDSVTRLGQEDPGWKRIADQELSYSNLLEFSREMTQAGLRRLNESLEIPSFNPDRFSWTLDSVHEFHHAMLEEAEKCGLDVRYLSGWPMAPEANNQKLKPPSSSEMDTLCEVPDP